MTVDYRRVRVAATASTTMSEGDREAPAASGAGRELPLPAEPVPRRTRCGGSPNVPHAPGADRRRAHASIETGSLGPFREPFSTNELVAARGTLGGNGSAPHCGTTACRTSTSEGARERAIVPPTLRTAPHRRRTHRCARRRAGLSPAPATCTRPCPRRRPAASVGR